MELQFVCVVLHKGAIKSNGVWLSALQLFVAMRRVHVICTLTRVIYGNSPRCERDRHYIWARWRSTLLLCATTNEWQCLFSIYTDRPNTESVIFENPSASHCPRAIYCEIMWNGRELAIFFRQINSALLLMKLRELTKRKKNGIQWFNTHMSWSQPCSNFISHNVTFTSPSFT